MSRIKISYHLKYNALTYVSVKDCFDNLDKKNGCSRDGISVRWSKSYSYQSSYFEKDNIIDCIDTNTINIDLNSGLVEFYIDIDFEDFVAPYYKKDNNLETIYEKIGVDLKLITDNTILAVDDKGSQVKVEGYILSIGHGVLRYLYLHYMKQHGNEDVNKLYNSLTILSDMEADFIFEIPEQELIKCIEEINLNNDFDYLEISIDPNDEESRLNAVKYLWNTHDSGVNGNEHRSLVRSKFYLDKGFCLKPDKHIIGTPRRNGNFYYVSSKVKFDGILLYSKSLSEYENIFDEMSKSVQDFITNVKEIDSIDSTTKKVYYIDKSGHKKTIDIVKILTRATNFEKEAMVYD